VAASLHSDFLMQAPQWRLRVFNNTMANLATVVEAALVLLPQDRIALGMGIGGVQPFSYAAFACSFSSSPSQE
jgi:hypothetical protein